MADIDSIIEGSLYQEIKQMKKGISIVMDPNTEKLYYKKVLDVFSIPVYRFLKSSVHPNIPQIKYFWLEEGKLIVIEELIQGCTLDELLEKGKDYKGNALCFEEKQRILLEICNGLIFLHSAKPPIIHRDVKASNIIIADDGSVKLIDYDAAKQYIEGKEKDTVLIGTQGVAAPEQYGFAQSDERTDIYQLGKLIERLLPDAKHAMEIADKATKLQPELRYNSVEQMKQQIEKLWNPAISDSKHRRIVAGKVIRSRRFIVCAVITLLAISGFLGYKAFMKYIYPEYYVRKPAYEAGVQAMQNGDYEYARNQFKTCGTDYKDVFELDEKCRVEIIKDGYVQTAESAIATYKKEATLVNARGLINACKEIQLQGIDNGEMLENGYQILEEMAKNHLANKSYGNACELYTYMTELGLYPEADEMDKYPIYVKGQDLCDEGNLREAIQTWTEINPYRDTQTKMNDARYKYVIEHLDSPDEFSRICMSHLKDVGYDNLDDISEKVYSWQADLRFGAVTGNEIDSYSRISISIKSGPTREKTNASIIISDSTGNSITIQVEDLRVEKNYEKLWSKSNGMMPQKGDSYNVKMYNENGDLMYSGDITLK